MLTVTSQNFSQEVLSAKGVTLVDFWAPWCMPCRILGPILDKIDKDYAHRAKVAKMNVDENQAISAQYGIMAIPTMIVFKDGKEVKRVSGVLPEKNIRTMLDEVLAST